MEGSPPLFLEATQSHIYTNVSRRGFGTFGALGSSWVVLGLLGRLGALGSSWSENSKPRLGPSPGRPGRLEKPPRPPRQASQAPRPPRQAPRPPKQASQAAPAAGTASRNAPVDIAPVDKTPPCGHVRRAPGRPDKLPGRPDKRPRLPGRPERHSRPPQLLGRPTRMSTQHCSVDNILPLSTRTTSRIAVATTWLLSTTHCSCRHCCSRQYTVGTTSRIAPVDHTGQPLFRGKPPP